MPDLIRHPEARSLDSYEGGNPGFILCQPSPRFLPSFVMLETQKSFEFKGLIETPLFPYLKPRVKAGSKIPFSIMASGGDEKGLT